MSTTRECLPRVTSTLNPIIATLLTKRLKDNIMPIKVTVNTPKMKKVKSYPKIMKSTMYIVLFSRVGMGTILDVLSDDASWCVADVRGSIPMSCYTDYNESITLQNK